jgi:drug/metabolite transporter (DMT)-like permease
MLFAGMRFALAGVLTVIIFSIARRKFICPKKRNLGKICIVSVFQTVLQYIFFYVGLSNTSGVKGTILSSASAFFALFVAGLLFKQEKITFKKILACIIGFAGIIFVNLNGLEFTLNFTGDCFVLFSALASAAASVILKSFSKNEDSVELTGYQFVVGGIVLVIIGMAFGGKVEVSGMAALGVLIYLAFLSAMAYSLWGILLTYNPVSKVTIYNFTIPVFGVLLSKLMLSESGNVSPLNLLITLVLVCTGIIMLNYKKREN